MDRKEKETQIALGTYLQTKWQEYLKVYAEGQKLAESSSEFTAEGCKCRAEGYKLTAEADLIFINAVIEVYGKDITISWESDNHCILGNGLEFKA